MSMTTKQRLHVRLGVLAHRLVAEMRSVGENPLLCPPDPLDPDSQLSVHERERLLRAGRRRIGP